MRSLEIEELHARVRAYMAAHMPALGRGPLVLAASGGADSAAMVALLCEAGIIDPSRTAVAHFDHRLRSEADAASDAASVRALCERYGLPLRIGAWEEPRRGEAAARDARYAFLRHMATSPL